MSDLQGVWVLLFIAAIIAVTLGAGLLVSLIAR